MRRRFSELYALSVYHPIGSLLKPKELITRMDAVDLIARAKKSNEAEAKNPGSATFSGSPFWTRLSWKICSPA
jgi:hypothetical protein